MTLTSFLRDEAGAVTVDWTVLTAGLVGMGLATVAVVSGGVEALSRDVDAQLREGHIISAFSSFAPGDILAEMDFSDGLGAWVGGRVVDLAGFGEVLELGPGVLSQLSVAIPEGASAATVSFDLIGVDDLSGAPATVYINGQAVAIYSDNHGNIQTSTPSVDGITVTLDQQYRNDPVGSGSHGHDSRATYTITVADPGETLNIAVGSGSGEPISDEFYAVDDVSVRVD